MRSLHHRQTMNYPYAAWRRILFVAVLVVIIVIAFTPATTQGTIFLRFSSLSSSTAVNHIYVGFTQIALHQAGFVNSTGWIVISQSFPKIDLLSDQTIPQPSLRRQSIPDVTTRFVSLSQTARWLLRGALFQFRRLL